MTHGSFTTDSALVNMAKNFDIAFVNFEKVGFYASPGYDLFNFMFTFTPEMREKYEKELLETYWNALIGQGVNPSDYT